MSSQTIQAKLHSNDLDIGMCGYLTTIARLQLFDFVNPFHFPSGFQAVIVKPNVQPSIWMVLSGLIGCIEGKAQLIILLLLLLSFVFGHLTSGAEHLLKTSGSLFRRGYFEATQDGMWYAIVVLSTVGLGDIAPRNLLSRSISVLWIFLSIGFTAMLLAVITANFFQLELVPDDPRDSITGLTSLAPFTIATAISSAATAVSRALPDNNITEFPTNSQAAVFRALLAGDFDGAVDRPEVVQHFNNFEPEFRDKLLPIGSFFHVEGVALAISRPAFDRSHPLYLLLSISVGEMSESWKEAQAMRWFGPAPAARESNPANIRAGLRNRCVPPPPPLDLVRDAEAAVVTRYVPSGGVPAQLDRGRPCRCHTILHLFGAIGYCALSVP
jgi:ABC-type amino acid transport substrate-binding protein